MKIGKISAKELKNLMNLKNVLKGNSRTLLIVLKTIMNWIYYPKMKFKKYFNLITKNE